MQPQRNGQLNPMNMPVPQIPLHTLNAAANLKYSSNTKMLNNNNNSIPHDTETWVRLCRTMLIDMESKNIKTRAVFWTKFVNDTTKKTMNKLRLMLHDDNFDGDYVKFHFTVSDPLKHLRFLAEWTGLKTQQMQYMPKSYTEFEYKAKNWLNGRKAPNYALTLFPEMIHRSEAYAESHSQRIFPTNKSSANLLSTTLRFGYLARLCSAKISLNDTGRKTPLLIENSIKTAKSTTSKIFQQYAMDHPYSSQFPSHTSEAATFFESKYQECLQRLCSYIQNGQNMSMAIPIPMDVKNNNIMPTIPPIPGIPTIPSIPTIPPLSDGDSHDSNDNNNSNNNTHNNNNSNGSIGSTFNFNMNMNQMITVTDLNNNHNNNGSAANTPSTANSNGSASTFVSRHNMTSPSTSSTFNLRSSNNDNNTMVISCGQYNELCATLDRLTATQTEQKKTIHQLVTRLQSLERVIDSQRNVINQFPLHSTQSIADSFWSTTNNNTPSMSSLQQHQSNPLSYSLAQDFMNANNDNNGNANNNNNTLASMASMASMVRSTISTPTLTTNSSTNTPHSPNTPTLNNYLSRNNNDGGGGGRNNNNNDDGDVDIADNEHNANNSTFPPGLFDATNDSQMFSVPNINLNNMNNFDSNYF